MTDILLLRYITGNASRSESRQVLTWVNESPENMEYFATLKARYVFSGFPNEILPEKKRGISPAVMAIAAALAIPLLVGSIYLYISRERIMHENTKATERIALLSSQTQHDVTYIANPGTKSVVTLPDSSVVHLNGDSRLVVPGVFGPDIRDVFLSGEGYFEVTHHEEWPMRVNTPAGVSVKVLGTTFNLSAYSNDPDVKVTLIEGRVQVKKENSSKIMELHPNQELKIANPLLTEQVSASAPQISHADIHKTTGWVNGELIFDNSPMSEIVSQLERWYGVTIHILDEDVLKYHMTASFTTESITRVMELFKFSSTLDYEINGTDVYIKRNKHNS